MNDYKTLIEFVSQQTALVPLTDPNEEYRDLGNYFKQKKWENEANGDGAPDVVEMVTRALDVCGLDSNRKSAGVSTLNQPANSQLRAYAATLLAMSLIRDSTEDILEQNLKRLKPMTSDKILAELRAILTKGDSVISKRFPKLEMKNFRSAGTRSKLWQFELEDAYQRANSMLGACEVQFVPPKIGGLAGKIDTAFREYFGDPNAMIDTTTLLFSAKPAKPTFKTASQKRVDVAREVMRRVCRNFVRQNVRVSFGGKAIDTGTFAYVSGKINPTRMHVGGMFFTKVQTGLGSEGGTIVHECTHTFAATRDHAYRPGPCKALLPATPEKALANADSYKFFIEAAFG